MFPIMAQCVTGFMILCMSIGSLGTTIEPQLQKTDSSKDLCDVSTKVSIVLFKHVAMGSTNLGKLIW